MSSFLYLASDMPFKEVKNPHFRQISIDEAIALGAEFPDYILNSGRSKPETVLWHDRKSLADASLDSDCEERDDDFEISPFGKEGEDILTKKKYCAGISFGPGEYPCIRGRAGRIAAYIREHLKQAGEVELWHIWLGDAYPPPRIKKVHIPMDELDASVIERVYTLNPPEQVAAYTAAAAKEWGIEEDELEAGTQYCYVIASSCMIPG